MRTGPFSFDKVLFPLFGVFALSFNIVFIIVNRMKTSSLENLLPSTGLVPGYKVFFSTRKQVGIAESIIFFLLHLLTTV